ncbi:MAG: UTP--glucose-1-phosphate uridylyltransferase [Oscillospiraceae bacterium]|nr:UTP--glucose-1-phosphate uridylyltransferase [Oscillospiraceae bacterium]
MEYIEALEKLKRYGQEHVLAWYDTLGEAERADLLREIEETDFSPLLGFRAALESRAGGERIEPLTAMELGEIDANRESFTARGLEAIRRRKLAAVLLAGGQGTRLGVDKSKGMVDIGLTHPLYIFECLFRNLMEVTERAGCTLPLYIMTSAINDEAIREFLREKAYFGYPAEEVRFFEQETCPAVDPEGKILMGSRNAMFMAPNGNGGWYKSMARAGITEELRREGIQWLNAFAVDNVLQRIADPCFLGAVLDRGCACGSKVIRKAFPEEKVGVMCRRNGRASVVEYYELTPEMMEERNENGDLAYNFGVILNYLFRVDALDRFLGDEPILHLAKKKVPCLNAAGEAVQPETENGYKLETLILDLVEKMDSCLPFEVVREREFAPIKNRTGVDSIESARELLELNGVVL